MFRFALALLVGLFLSGSASAGSFKDLPAEVKAAIKARIEAREAKLKAEIEAAKIPAVTLSEKQIAKLKATAPNDQVVWYRAGRQSDGNTFVCLVTNGKTLWGPSRVQVFAGAFESDGSFQQTLAYLQSAYAVRNDCRKRGFDPPVSITGGLGF